MLQVRELIGCFPDEDEHLLRLSHYKPKSMTIEKLMSLLTCPPSMQV